MPKRIVALSILLLVATSVLAEKVITLPTPKGNGKMSVEESILRRRSVREFHQYDLSNEQLSQLLWVAQGISDAAFKFRTAPSAGALYPLTIYIARKDGIYRYVPVEHKLVQVSSEDKRPSLVRGALAQTFLKEAPVVMIIAANFKVTYEKYGPRAFRYVFTEIGHVAENVHLQAVALNLGSVPVGAFWDDVIKSALGLPEEQDPLYLIPIGYPRT
ncbi:MAG: SagB/ThcOx family dehydrogenase [Candidatus Margulisbacteria bacterium]|nr:SagB/ThcOx family dehydrogenase [Candidatus Margulisiibacteriota bacterium]